MNKKVLVLGITGGVGSASAEEFLKRGWKVIALHRDPERAKEKFPQFNNVQWVKGDAMNLADVMLVARNTDVILHGVNPPGYKDWQKLAVPMLQNSLQAAMIADARLIFPGNVYNFSKQAPDIVNEETPHAPDTIKGKIRSRMEQLLADKSAQGAKVLIVRAGDYFGPNAPGSWFSNVMVKAGKPVKSVIYPGQPDIGHSWAYLPDFAATIVSLMEQENKLADYDCFHFKGHQFDRGVDMAEAVCRVAGLPDSKINSFPWMLVNLTAPFVRLFGELKEMRYLWERPLALQNNKLLALLETEPHTPIDQALRQTLKAMKSL